MPWNVLIFPLVAGYYFLSNCKRYKYFNQRLDRQWLIFNSVICGIGLFIASYVIVALIPENHLFYKLKPHFQYEYLGTSLLSLILSLALVQVTNAGLDDTKEIYASINKIGNDMERLIAKSYVNFELIQFTLSNDKFYIGIATEIPPPGNLSYLKIKPLYSGYRSDETKRLIFINDYSKAYDSYSDDDPANDISMTVIIKTEDVITATPFDLGIYARFNKNEPKTVKP